MEPFKATFLGCTATECELSVGSECFRERQQPLQGNPCACDREALQFRLGLNTVISLTPHALISNNGRLGMKHDISDDDEVGSSGGGKRARVRDDNSSLPGSSPPPLPSQADEDEVPQPAEDDDDADTDAEMADSDADEQEERTQGLEKLKSKKREVGVRPP